MLLCISLLAPFVGPLLLVRLGRTPRVAAAVDGFVLVAMGGLIGLHALPESIAQLGWPALVAATLGLFVPKVLHAPRPSGCDGRHGVNWVGALAVLAVVAHAVADGVGLVAPGELAEGAHAALAHGHVHGHAHGHGHGQDWLPWAVALHRAVEGTGLWWLMRGEPRAWRRWAALLGLGAATWAGHAAGGWALGHGFAPGVALLQASVAGSLAHVLLWHAPISTAPAGAAGGTVPLAARARQLQAASSGVGALVAATLLWCLSASEAGQGLGTALAAADAALQAPWARRAALVGLTTALALAAAALLHARGGEPMPVRLGVGRWREATAGALAGLLQTSCSCGVLPLARVLRRRGASRSYVAAFVAAAPAMGLVGAALSLTLLGPALTLLRAAGAAALAVGAGLAAPAAVGGPTGHDDGADLVVKLAAGRQAQGCGCDAAGPGATWRRLRDGCAFAFGEVLDFEAPWLVAGLALAWTLEGAFAPEALGMLAAVGVQVPMLALWGAPLYLCASASTLVAAALLGKGASAGAALAFLWSSSSLSPALLADWRRRGASASTARFVAVVLLGAALGGWAVDAALGGLCVTLPFATPAGPTTTWSLALAVGLALRALMRGGVRGVAGQLARHNRVGPPSHHHGH